MTPKPAPAANMPRAFATQKYTIARSNLMMMAFLTLLNIVLAASGATFYLPFCAVLPYSFAITGRIVYLEGGSMAASMLTVFVVIAVLLAIPILLCALFAKKHYGWMIAAFVCYLIDTAGLLYFMLFSGDTFDATLILDAAFHAWVIYYLIIGVKYGKLLRTLPEDESADPQEAGAVVDIELIHKDTVSPAEPEVLNPSNPEMPDDKPDIPADSGSESKDQ